MNIKELNLKNGDLIFFSSKHGFIVNGIKLFQWCRWNHIGIVLEPRQFGKLTVYESAGRKHISDLITGTDHNGVLVTDLEERINTFNGDIAIRRLKGYTFTEEDLYTLKLLRFHLRGSPYEQDIPSLFKAALPFLSNKQEDLSSIFCSELVAYVYKVLGMLPDSINSSNYTVRSFIKLNSLEKGYLTDLEIIKHGD